MRGINSIGERAGEIVGEADTKGEDNDDTHRPMPEMDSNPPH